MPAETKKIKRVHAPQVKRAAQVKHANAARRRERRRAKRSEASREPRIGLRAVS